MILKPIAKVVFGAIKGAIAILIILILLTTIFALPYGGPFILLYYWAYVVFYILPLGLLLGASFSLFTLFSDNSPSESKQKRKPVSRFGFLGIALIFLIIFALISIPYSSLDQEGQVEHAAKWFYVEPDDENLMITEQVRDDCDIQLVLFVLELYEHHDVVCNQAVLDYLRTLDDKRVRLVYRVTYDFGDPRSYQLIVVGSVPISWGDWIASWGGCGGAYSNPCNSPNLKKGSHLLESTWSDG